jgi:hypothetical protein
MQQRNDFARITGGFDVVGHVKNRFLGALDEQRPLACGLRRSGVDASASDRATPMAKVVDGSGRRRLSWTPYQAD